MKKPTIADVAEKAGVSKPTVSRYLKNENVRNDIAKKIQDAIEAVGYVAKSVQGDKEEAVCEPNLDLNKKTKVKKASKLKEKKGYRFAVLVKDITSLRTREMIQALQGVFMEAGCTFQVVCTSGLEELEETYLTSFILQNISAILVEGCSSPEFIRRQMRTTAIPVVFLRHSSEDAAVDEVQAGYELAKYLLDKKHLMVRYIGADDSLSADHMEGIRKAYHALKQPIDLLAIETQGNYVDMFEKIKEIFADPIDLLILQSDEMAVPFSKYLKEYHIAVPQNVSLVSFGGSMIAEVISPTLTTLSYEYEAYADYICQYVCALVEKKALPEKKNFFHMEVRDSVR